MVSNRPRHVKKALDAYGFQGEWILVCPEAMRQDMRQAAIEHTATIITEKAFLDQMPKNIQSVFAKSHGGVRNMALALAAKEKKDLIFLDDDTTPQSDVFDRFGKLFSSHNLVIGKYNHHVGGASTALLDLTHALGKFNAKKITEIDFLQKMQERISGVPPVQKPVQGAGVVGGCLGIASGIARVHCFFPIPFRVEDGTFASLSPQPPFNPPLSEAPIVRHEKSAVLGKLFLDLENEWRGNVLAGFVVAEKKNQPKTLESVSQEVRKGLLIEFFNEKYSKSVFRHPWLDQISNIDVQVTYAECQKALAGYNFVQTVWQEAWQAA